MRNFFTLTTLLIALACNAAVITPPVIYPPAEGGGITPSNTYYAGDRAWRPTTNFWERSGTTTNLLEVRDTDGTNRFTIGPTGILHGNGAGLSNAPGLASISIRYGLSLTNGAPTPIWTNTVPTNTSYWLTFWGTGGSRSNQLGFHCETFFYRFDGDVLWAGSNNISKIGSANLNIYAMTNTSSNVVLYVKGMTNESDYWSVDGYAVSRTNATGFVEEPVTQLDPATNIWVVAYYLASSLSSSNDGTEVLTWADQSAYRNFLFNYGVPTKETTDGKTVVRFDGASSLYTTTLQWATNFGNTGYGTMVARIKPGTNWQSQFYAWADSTGGSDISLNWLPYEGTIYADWKAPGSARVSATAPVGWENNWHTLVIQKTADLFHLRVDGTTLSTTTNSNVYITGQGVFVLGANNNNSGSFWVGDVRGLVFFKDSENLPLTDADKYGEWLNNH